MILFPVTLCAQPDNILLTNNLTRSPSYYIRIEQGGGDLLYIPPLWFHLAASLRGSISANVWSLSAEIHSFEAALRVGLPDALGAPDVEKAGVVAAPAPWSSLARVAPQKLRCLLALITVVVRDVVPSGSARDAAEREGARAPLRVARRFVRSALYQSRYAPIAEELACPGAAALQPHAACAMDDAALAAADVEFALSAKYGARVAAALRPACDAAARGGCVTIVANWVEEVVSAVLGPLRACAFALECVRGDGVW